MDQALQAQTYGGTLHYLDIHTSGTLADLAQARADLAIIALPPGDVAAALELSGRMACRAALVISSGITAEQSTELKKIARREGIRTDRYTPWYAAGCEWAKANGISDGSNPEAPVTREQLAAMLYRYAALKGRDLTAGENLNFTDASDVSAYALPALQWATGEKILTGSNGALNPQATATRAHLAAILHRYFG